MFNKEWDEITYKFQVSTVRHCNLECIYNFIPHDIGHVITNPCLLVKGAPCRLQAATRTNVMVMHCNYMHTIQTPNMSNLSTQQMARDNVSFVCVKSDLCPSLVLYAILCYTGPRYVETLLYSGYWIHQIVKYYNQQGWQFLYILPHSVTLSYIQVTVMIVNGLVTIPHLAIRLDFQMAHLMPMLSDPRWCIVIPLGYRESIPSFRVRCQCCLIPVGVLWFHWVIVNRYPLLEWDANVVWSPLVYCDSIGLSWIDTLF